MERITYQEISFYTPLTKYYAYQSVVEDEMGCACGMHGEDDKCMQGYGGEVWRGITRWERIIREMDWRWKNGLIWLRVGTGGGLLWKR
jgi:hypothetical protein